MYHHHHPIAVMLYFMTTALYSIVTISSANAFSYSSSSTFSLKRTTLPPPLDGPIGVSSPKSIMTRMKMTMDIPAPSSVSDVVHVHSSLQSSSSSSALGGDPLSWPSSPYSSYVSTSSSASLQQDMKKGMEKYSLPVTVLPQKPIFSTTTEQILQDVYTVFRPPSAQAMEQQQQQQQQQQQVVVVTTSTTTISSPSPPTNEEIKLLREALGAVYGERNPEKAVDLLSRTISAWERQAPDERAALYRVRGDCYMELLNAPAALEDYTLTLALLTGPGGELADPAELPAAYLGQARALRSLPFSSSSSSSSNMKLSKEQYHLAAQDYQLAMRLTASVSGNDDDDLEEEDKSTTTNGNHNLLEMGGIKRNPYAGWEWGMALRGEGDYEKASNIHILASNAFKDIGDGARSVICKLDAGIDLAAAVAAEAATTPSVDTTTTGTTKSRSTGDNDVVMKQAQKVLEEAIASTTTVEGRDVELLQRVIAKEGEARMALASILWTSSNNQDKSAAEAQFGKACERLEQLQIDADARAEKARTNGKKSGGTAVANTKVKKLPFTMDDYAMSAGTEWSCSRFKNSKFLDSIFWPEALQEKVFKLNNLS